MSAARIVRDAITRARETEGSPCDRLAVGAVMGATVCGLDVQPGCTPLVPSGELTLFGAVTWREALFGIFLGFLMHHYYIDQFIWRPSRDAELRKDLNLTGGAAQP